MSKTVKTVVSIIIILITLFSVIGCDKEEDNYVSKEELAFAKEENVRYAERFQNLSLSEAGIITDNTNEGMIHLITIDEGEDMIFCYDPNCRHIPVTEAHPDSECMAALILGSTRTAYYEGCIYFFVQDSIFSHKIYKMKTDGAGRTIVAELPFGCDIKKGCIFNGDKVYYIAKMSTMDEVTYDITTTARIVEVNLLDGSYRLITEDTNDQQLQMDMADSTLYIRRADSKTGLQYGIRVNIETLNEECFIDSETWHNAYACMGAYDDDSFFYFGYKNNDIGIRNVDGTIEKVLVQGAEGETYGWPDVSCDGLFYQRTIDYGDEKAGYYFLDFITGEVINVTDEQAKYGLFGYDGYYDAFVAHDGTFKNWTMWSKEKVLGEAKE